MKLQLGVFGVLIGVLRPVKIISLILSRGWAKTGDPREKLPDYQFG